MFRPVHCGLYFTENHIQAAWAGRERDPLAAAWRQLADQHPIDPLPLAQWYGFLYRFNGNTDAGKRGINVLFDLPAQQANAPIFEATRSLIAEAQCFELLRDHPQIGDPSAWLTHFADRAATLDARAADAAAHERPWLTLLKLAAGIVLEDEGICAAAADRYRATIAEEVHPEGYIGPVVRDEHGDSLYRLVLATAALVLTAEAGATVGFDLWDYEVRGVSALTPTPYVLYYYYYPEKWRWAVAPEYEAGQRFYRDHGGFWEIVYRRGRSRDVRRLLDDLRPLYDPYGGGFTTLTHGPDPARRRGLFG